MNDETAIDIPGAPQPLMVREPVAAPEPSAITPAQAKINAVAALTMSAYEKAATLKLTDEESAALQADFPDDAFKSGAAGKENLLYIEHAYLRDRFMQVFGQGQWALIPRNRWAEPFRTKPNRDNPQGQEGSRVYVEAMLVVRGCFVGEAIGEMEYYPHNHAQNYGDAVEGAKTAAFRRCAKEFGVGLQAWKKDWCEGWWKRKRGNGGPLPPPPQRPAPAPPASASPLLNRTPQPPISREPTEATRKWMIAQMEPYAQDALAFAIESGYIMPNENLSDWPLNRVPTTRAGMSQLEAEIQYFHVEGKLPKPETVRPASMSEPPIEVPRENVDTPEGQEEWRVFPMPFGKDAGIQLAELEKKTLYGWWANYTVEEEYNGRPKKPETIAKDQRFREMLDAAGQYYNFEKKD